MDRGKNMRLNLDYYKEDIPYKLEKNEDIIIEYITTKTQDEIEDLLREQLDDNIVLNLSNLRKNLVYSCEFEPNSTVLEIGAHFGQLTGALCEKNQKVVSVEFMKRRAEAIAERYKDIENLEIIVGKLQDIQFEEKFDYITLFGVLEYSQIFFNTKFPANDFIAYCKNLLKPNGKLLIAIDNKFALKSYIGQTDDFTGITFDSITGYKSSRRHYKLGKRHLENILNEVGLQHFKFYYPLPDYKLPSLIFTDNYLPSSSKINGYFPYYKDDSFVFYSEVDAYDAIVKENREMFPFFANSYLIEASAEPIQNDTKFISFNNYRKPEYQLMTKIKETTVEKTIANQKAIPHLNGMKENIENLRNENINIIDEAQGEKIQSQFRKEKLASQLVSDNVENLDEILKILNLYNETIQQITIPYEEGMETIFDKYMPDIDIEIKTQFRYLKNGYWDMILKNCFIIDGKCVFFDQEWKEANIPAEFLLYRSIVNVEKLRSKIEEYELFEKMGIQEYIPIFQELDRKITMEIIDEKIFAFYQKSHKNPIYENYELLKERKQLQEKIQELEMQIQQLETKGKNIEEEKEQKEQEIVNLQGKINRIYESKSWKFVRKLSKIKHAFKK